MSNPRRLDQINEIGYYDYGYQYENKEKPITKKFLTPLREREGEEGEEYEETKQNEAPRTPFQQNLATVCGIHFNRGELRHSFTHEYIFDSDWIGISYVSRGHPRSTTASIWGASPR